MVINELAALGHAIATVLFACLSVLMLSRWKNRRAAGSIAVASGVMAGWAGLQSAGSFGYVNAPVFLLIAEWARSLAWLAVLIALLRDMDAIGRIVRSPVGYATAAAGAVLMFLLYSVNESDATWAIRLVISSGIVLSALLLVLTEQVYRNAPIDARSGLRYFCVGVAGIFAYDLIIFTLTIVNREMSVDQWASRGFVNALFALPMGLAALRSFRLSLDELMPRQIVFYFFGLITAGVYVLIILIGNYYITTYAGSWGGVTRIVLFVAALGGLVLMLVSSTMRARVRVFVTKSFFQFKYDYRKEWLRFIGTLSETENDVVTDTAVRAVAQIVNSPGGIVWVQEHDGKDYLPVGAWGTELPIMSSVDQDARMVKFLRQRQWVIDLNEMRADPSRYGDLAVEPWASEHEDWWLIVPLLLGDRLYGFIVLQKPKIAPTLNFEDHDLLRTVGRHVATHINQAESDRRLAEASQFGTYNRLTAFLMHDLNNLIAQQSLVVKNAEKFRHNPQFVDDAIDTIANSVSRMRRLMEQLSSGKSRSTKRSVDVAKEIQRAISSTEPRLPRPRFKPPESSTLVEADPERLMTVIEHLIRNAQDATDDDGQVVVEFGSRDGIVEVTIADDGCGMTPDFVRERLFRPFDSTKGSQSMGIGAFQAREFIREIGGQLTVASQPGEGTRFTLRLPLLRDTQPPR